MGIPKNRSWPLCSRGEGHDRGRALPAGGNHRVDILQKKKSLELRDRLALVHWQRCEF